MNASDPLTPPLDGVQRLDDWALIQAGGDDAAAFLQGQLSNDVLGMQAGEARWAGYCTAKGRLIATFLVVRQPGGGFLLACSADLLAAVNHQLHSGWPLQALQHLLLEAEADVGAAAGERAVEGADVRQRVALAHHLGVERQRHAAQAPARQVGEQRAQRLALGERQPTIEGGAVAAAHQHRGAQPGRRRGHRHHHRTRVAHAGGSELRPQHRRRAGEQHAAEFSSRRVEGERRLHAADAARQLAEVDVVEQRAVHRRATEQARDRRRAVRHQ
ncbi:MAG: hypothetical protein J0M20_09635, partial [Burkholderiales bacterium]|nr:hypothetical protein [Burkholderiales bacterium]